MKTRVLAGMLILAAGAGVVVGLSGDKGVGDPQPIAVSEDRAIKIDGACPVGTTQEAAKCKVKIADGQGGCICITDQAKGSVDGEVDKAGDLAPAKQKVMLLCRRSPGDRAADVYWDTGDKAVPKDCQIVAKSMIGEIDLGAVDTDEIAQLREACRPCDLGGGMGPCPRCIIGEPGKSDCKALCPAPAEPK
jgi:hypothetical protein